MAKLIIHAGLHKTGTSAIQKTLCNNRKFLWENGFYYPDPAPFEAHHAFASRLKNIPALDDGIRDVEKTLSAYKQGADGRTVLLSSEMFSAQVDPACFQTLPNIFDSIKIIFYIRQQDSMRESAYNQQVKAGKESRSIDDYQPYRWDYYSHLKSFSCAVEDSDVYALEYDKSLFIDEDINTDFFERVLMLPYSAADFEENTTVNKSLSVVSCAILARLNRLSISDQKRRKAIEILISTFPVCDFKQYTLMNDNFRLELMAKSKSSNKKLRRDFLRSGEFKYCDMNKIYLEDFRLNKIIRESSIIEMLSSVFDDTPYNLTNTLKF